MKPLLATFILSFLILPLVTFAQYAPPVGPDGTISEGLVPCEGAFCNTCHVVVLANTGIKWLLTLSFLFFAILALRAGWKLIISQGNPGALADAKQSFTNAFIGLAIILTAWILVDTLMRNLIGNGGVIERYGPWAQVQCTEQNPVNQARQYFAGDPEFTPPTSSPGVTATPDPTADGQYTYQAGISAQRVHASAALNRMLNCMANILPANAGEISSISDGNIIRGTRTWSQCRLGGQSAGCAHTRGSLHYGGSGSTAQCGDRSFAVDFGDEQNERVICAAANACGQNNCGIHNGNHVHLSVPITCN